MLDPTFPAFKPGAPLPPYRPARAAILAALPALAPPARVSVSEAATRRMVDAGGHWTPWRNDVAPYMVEPMNVTTSRRFEVTCFVGPARSSKTEALILNPIAHAILCAPRLVHVVHMTQSAAREFSIETLDKLVRNSPELAARRATGKGADNTFDKSYKAGARVTIGWPVVPQLSARSIPLVLLTDFDRMPADLSGEGSAFALARKRTQSAGSRGMTVVESSPGFPILDESWTPATPHQAPPCGGVLSIYNTGTRARYYWTCPDCGGAFEPGFDRLIYPDEGSPATRAAATMLACLHCGSLIEPRHKPALNAGGQWLHESDAGALVPLGDLVRATAVASYWLAGPAAAFATWATLVARYLEGVETFEATGDESTLKSAVNLDLGLPYLPRAKAEGQGLSESALRNAASDREWRVAPFGARFLTVAIDVQPGRFVVQVEAWGVDLERTLIDRFDIHTPPASAPRAADRQISPARFQEDWDALLALADRAYPVANAAHALRPAAIICDSAGEAGVTPNAYSFHRRTRALHRNRFYLARGVGGDRVKRAEMRTPETAHKGKRHVARDVPIVFAGTDRLKDEIAASLLRDAEGARALHIPRGAPREVFAEYAAERRGPKGWEKKPGVKRNEALDLSVYALALAIVLGAEKINPAAPPAWARADASNLFAVASAAAPTPDRQAPPVAPTPAARPRRAPRRFDGW